MSFGLSMSAIISALGGAVKAGGMGTALKGGAAGLGKVAAGKVAGNAIPAYAQTALTKASEGLLGPAVKGATQTGLPSSSPALSAESIFGSPNLTSASNPMFSTPQGMPSGGELSTWMSPQDLGGGNVTGESLFGELNFDPSQVTAQTPGADEMSNLQKMYIMSNLYKNSQQGEQQKTQYPTLSMPSPSMGRAAPQMAQRQPLRTGGFMGAGRKPRLGRRRY